MEEKDRLRLLGIYIWQQVICKNCFGIQVRLLRLSFSPNGFWVFLPGNNCTSILKNKLYEKIYICIPTYNDKNIASIKST